MTNAWTEDGINKATGTRFTAAGWDQDGFNAEGFDKLDNRRGGELHGKMTRALTRLIKDYEEGETFTKAEANPSFWRASGMSAGERRSFFTYQEAIEDLMAAGFIIKAGRRWMVNTEKAKAELPEVYKEKEN